MRIVVTCSAIIIIFWGLSKANAEDMSKLGADNLKKLGDLLIQKEITCKDGFHKAMESSKTADDGTKIPEMSDERLSRICMCLSGVLVGIIASETKDKNVYWNNLKECNAFAKAMEER